MAVVRYVSRPGDVIVDFCAGGVSDCGNCGTWWLPCAMCHVPGMLLWTSVLEGWVTVGHDAAVRYVSRPGDVIVDFCAGGVSDCGNCGTWCCRGLCVTSRDVIVDFCAGGVSDCGNCGTWWLPCAMCHVPGMLLWTSVLEGWVTAVTVGHDGCRALCVTSRGCYCRLLCWRGEWLW